MTYITPKKILVEFLRANMKDPRGRAESLKTESKTATAGQKVFSLNPDSSLSAVISLKVNSTVKSKWSDYYVNLDSVEVGFYDGLNDGDVVEVTYKQGSTNWIYWDKDYKKISRDAFPRISVQVTDSPGLRLGQYNAPIQSMVAFQVDVWTKEKMDGQIFTIDGIKYFGDSLAEKIGYDVSKILSDKVEELHPALYNLNVTSGPRDMPFELNFQLHRSMLEIELNTLDISRI